MEYGSLYFFFNLDEPPAYKVFCEPETIHYKKLNKSVLNTITFFIENNDHEEVIFNGQTLSYALQMIKISTNNRAFKNLKRIVTVLAEDTDLPQKNFSGDITSKGSRLKIGYCSICNRTKSMTVSENTVIAEGLGDFFKNLGKKNLKTSEKLAKERVKKL